jgi:hypothetical protein
MAVLLVTLPRISKGMRGWGGGGGCNGGSEGRGGGSGSGGGGRGGRGGWCGEGECEGADVLAVINGAAMPRFATSCTVIWSTSCTVMWLMVITCAVHTVPHRQWGLGTECSRRAGIAMVITCSAHSATQFVGALWVLVAMGGLGAV